MMNKRDYEIDITELMEKMKSDVLLPDPCLLNYYRMNRERKLWFDFSVDESTLDNEQQILMWNM